METPVRRDQSLSGILIALQFLLSALAVLTVDLESVSLASAGVSAVGILLWGWSIASMKPSQLSISEEVAAKSQLVTRRPYNRVRHPMYTGLALFTLGCVFAPFQWWRILSWLALAIVLDAKARREEQHLLVQFPEYAEYRSGTKRFILFVY